MTEDCRNPLGRVCCVLMKNLAVIPVVFSILSFLFPLIENISKVWNSLDVDDFKRISLFLSISSGYAIFVHTFRFFTNFTFIAFSLLAPKIYLILMTFPVWFTFQNLSSSIRGSSKKISKTSPACFWYIKFVHFFVKAFRRILWPLHSCPLGNALKFLIKPTGKQ